MKKLFVSIVVVLGFLCSGVYAAPLARAEASQDLTQLRQAAERGEVLAQFELAQHLAPDDALAAMDWLARARINASFTAAQCSDPKARAVVGMARLHYAELLAQLKPPQSIKESDRSVWRRTEMRQAMRKALKNYHENVRQPLPSWLCSERLPEKQIRRAHAELRKLITAAIQDKETLIYSTDSVCRSRIW